MNKIKTWIQDHWVRVLYWILMALIGWLLVGAWANVSERTEALETRLDGIEATTTTTTEAPLEHCGCEGACDKCHHLCLECKCGSHIIDRGPKCQEFAACEAGCSGEELEGSDGAEIDCDVVRGQADILGSNMAENYTDNDALKRDTGLLQELLSDCGCASAGVGYSGADVKCPCNVCPWNCL